MGRIFLFCLAGILVLSCTVSCKSRTEYQNDRSIQAILDHYRFKNQELTDGKALTVQDCITASMNNTLAVRFQAAAEKKVDPQAAVEILGLLPSFQFQDDLSAKSGVPTVSSRRPNYYNIDFMIGLLDLGLGYWYTKETLSKAAYREQLLRKTANKIRFETVSSYYRAGALQVIVFQLESQLERLRRESKAWLRAKNDPVLAARVLRKLGNFEQSLHKTEEACSTAAIHLRTLMGLYPVPDVNLDSSVRQEPRPLALPSLAFMEQIALSRRPELYMGDIRKSVSLPACYGFIRQILPELPDGDQCSINNNCQLGARALYDLLQAPDRYAGKGTAAKERLTSIHSYAEALAVMAQVRMAYNEYQIAQGLYKKSRVTLADCEALLKKGRKGTLEYADMLLDTLDARLKKEYAAMRCRIAESRILYTMGISQLDERLVDTVDEELADAARLARADLRKARQQYSEEQIRILNAELKKLQEEEAERKTLEEEKIRKSVNKEIDKKYGTYRNPALWEKICK